MLFLEFESPFCFSLVAVWAVFLCFAGGFTAADVFVEEEAALVFVLGLALGMFAEDFPLDFDGAEGWRGGGLDWVGGTLSGMFSLVTMVRGASGERSSPVPGKDKRPAIYRLSSI